VHVFKLARAVLGFLLGPATPPPAPPVRLSERDNRPRPGELALVASYNEHAGTVVVTPSKPYPSEATIRYELLQVLDPQHHDRESADVLVFADDCRYLLAGDIEGHSQLMIQLI
jgi:hypothetical protein